MSCLGPLACCMLAVPGPELPETGDGGHLYPVAGTARALGDERCGGSVLVPLGPSEPSFGGP